MKVAKYNNDILLTEIDFDIKHTFDCGQCFRFVPDREGYLGVAYNKVLKLTSTENGVLIESNECDFENRMSMSSLGGVETVDLIIDVLGFTDVEKRIALSKLRQQRTQDFLKENKDISSVTYSRALASVKEKLSQAYDI